MNMIDTIKKGFKGSPDNEIKEKSYQSTSLYDSEMINHKFDYSNAVPTKESVTHLVKYCNSIYEQYLWLINEDEKKEVFKDYTYQKKYHLFLDVRIRDQRFNNITCSSYEAFKKAVIDGKLDNIDSMEIRLNIDYKKNNVMCTNLFTILIRPFNLQFLRKSNYKQVEMNVVENSINEILSRFHTVNSLFCTK